MGRQSVGEINIRRLLARCEAMASNAQHVNNKIDWRLPKYLNHLSNELEILQQNKDAGVSEDVLQEYKRKISFLKDIVKADAIDNPLERTLVCQHLLPSSVIHTNRSDHGDYSPSKELHLQIKGKHHQDLRNELFGKDHGNDIRHRKIADSTKDNIDDIIKQHHDMQEKVAEEMIHMAKSMKENSLIARDIIKRDNQELDSAKKIVDTNYKKLKTESARLDEINKKKCSFTIWIMLGIVCIVFIYMIIFIKFFPKKKR